MQSKAKTVGRYIASLPKERQASIQAVRRVIVKNLPQGYEETMQYGMISYVVPLRSYPTGYLGQKDVPLPYAGLASQKNYMSLYLMATYGDKAGEARFKKEYKASGKKLNMGKSCIRFKSVEDLALPVIGKAIRRMPVKKFIAAYERAREGSSRRH